MTHPFTVPTRRQMLAALGATAALPFSVAHAQTATKILVPAAAGGTTDLLSRLYAQWLSEEWGRPWWPKTVPAQAA